MKRHPSRTSTESKRFTYNVGIEATFTRKIMKLFKEMAAEVKKTVVPKYAMDAGDLELPDITPSTIDAIIATLMAKYVAMFADEGIAASSTMADALLKVSNASLNNMLETIYKRDAQPVLFTRESPKLESPFYLNKNTFSSELSEYTRAAIAETTSLIKSIPQKYLSQTRDIMYKSLTSGEGSRYINANLGKLTSISARRVQLMSLDQTRKIYSKVTAYKMQSLGLTRFRWIHSGGGKHPRPSHIHELNGKIFSFDDLPIINKDDKNASPERGLPGQAINCKCVMGFVYDYE